MPGDEGGVNNYIVLLYDRGAWLYAGGVCYMMEERSHMPEKHVYMIEEQG